MGERYGLAEQIGRFIGQYIEDYRVESAFIVIYFKCTLYIDGEEVIH